MRKTLLVLNLILLVVICGNGVMQRYRCRSSQLSLVSPLPPVVEQPKERKPDISYGLSDDPRYSEIQDQLDLWHKQAPDQTEIGFVGRSSTGQAMRYLRIGKKSGPKVLVFAGIHGNEKLAVMVMTRCINSYLKDYMEDANVTDLLNTRDLYYIPIANPDGFTGNLRNEDGEDPNRCWLDKNFNDKKSVCTVEYIKQLHRNIQFNAVLSCHNYGRVYMIPWGYKNAPTDSETEYRRITSIMSKYTGYKPERLYGNAVGIQKYGYEDDWFYKFGAFSLVVEIGDVFEAKQPDIDNETKTNYPAFLVFLKEAPLVRGGACTATMLLDEWDIRKLD